MFDQPQLQKASAPKPNSWTLWGPMPVRWTGKRLSKPLPEAPSGSEADRSGSGFAGDAFERL
jgi:hypothetical protein